MTATEIHHGFVAFSSAFPLPLLSTGRDALMAVYRQLLTITREKADLKPRPSLASAQ
jgi:hypothetical protein